MADPTFYIKQNDTRPELDIFLRDDKDRTINITGATVNFSMRNASTNVVKISLASVTTVNSTAGRVKYHSQHPIQTRLATLTRSSRSPSWVGRLKHSPMMGI